MYRILIGIRYEHILKRWAKSINRGITETHPDVKTIIRCKFPSVQQASEHTSIIFYYSMIEGFTNGNLNGAIFIKAQWTSRNILWKLQPHQYPPTRLSFWISQLFKKIHMHRFSTKDDGCKLYGGIRFLSNQPQEGPQCKSQGK